MYALRFTKIRNSYEFRNIKRTKKRVQAVVNKVTYPFKEDVFVKLNELEQKIEARDEKIETMLSALKFQSLCIEELRNLIIEEKDKIEPNDIY